MRQRVLTAVIGLALCLFMMLLSVYTRALLVLAIMGVAIYEMCTALDKIDYKSIFVMLEVFAAGAALLLFCSAKKMWLVGWGSLCVMACMVLAMDGKRYVPKDIFATFAVAVYPLMPMLVIFMVCVSDQWAPVVLMACVSAWLSDSAALFGGSRFGKTKLAPAISPRKTVEGALWGLGSSFISGTVLYSVYHTSSMCEMNFFACVLSAFLCALAGQFGDLVASMYKRLCGIKDYSNILPGHGGILDRFDSILFAMPVACFCMWMFGIFV